MSDKRYIHLITSLEAGGAQKVLFDYFTNIDAKTIEKSMVVSLRKRDLYTDKLESIGVKVISVDKLYDWFKVFKILISRYNCFKAWMYHACFLTLIPRCVGNVDIVWSIHHGRIDFKTDSISTIIFSKLCALMSNIIPRAVVFVSDDCKRNHFGLGFNKLNSHVIYNFVDSKFFVPDPITRLNSVAFVGRDHPNKNLDLFLKVAREFHENKQSISFFVAGELSESRLKEYSYNNVTFLGRVNDVKSVYQNAKVYVCTSYTESFGLTLIEASLCGCVVVCPDEKIFREVTFNKAIYYKQDNLFCLYSSIEKALRINATDSGISCLIKDKYSSENTIERLKSLIQG
ncbi:glycosyltransferase [Vibrio cholerae]|nr:glycosyltransferase [Vibrio cholerae]